MKQTIGRMMVASLLLITWMVGGCEMDDYDEMEGDLSEAELEGFWVPGDIPDYIPTERMCRCAHNGTEYALGESVAMWDSQCNGWTVQKCQTCSWHPVPGGECIKDFRTLTHYFPDTNP